MGLIARVLEAAGYPTLSLSSAYSITRAVHPPRAVFIDFPLGHTSGKPHDAAQQDDLLRRALHGFQSIRTPGDVLVLPDSWHDGVDGDAWKDAVLNPGGDDRTERAAEPQYQLDADRALADAALASGGCPSCVWTAP